MPKRFRIFSEEFTFLKCSLLPSENFPFSANTLPSQLALIDPENTET